MRKRMFLMIVIVALMALVLPVSVAAQEGEESMRTGIRPDAPPYGVRGPYPVGTMEVVIDPEERPMETTIWYPALNPDDLDEMVTYTTDYQPALPPFTLEGHALRDAPPDVEHGPYPLVLFSTGATWYRYAAIYLTEHLASHGFIVMAVDHFGDTPLNAQDEDVFVRSHTTRPVDITRQIDFAATLAEQDAAWTDVIDLDQIAVLGMSSGGWTALYAGGAQRDFGYLSEWCEQFPDDFWTCGTLLGQAEKMAELTGLDTVPEGLWPSVGDPRVDAIVPIVPGNIALFGPDGLSVVTTPALIIASGNDMLLPPDEHSLKAYAQLGSPDRTLVTFAYANHMLSTNTCMDWQIAAGMAGWCSDPVWDMDRAHDLIDHFTTAFLLAELYGDEDAAAALAPDAVQFLGITYETTGY